MRRPGGRRARRPRHRVARGPAPLPPDLVVDASGPFQCYGVDPHRFARAALACDAHYVDIADGAAFVTGIGALDADAVTADRFALSGASTHPVLAWAAASELAAGMASVTSVTTGIAPSPRAGLGPTSYGPWPRWRGGRSSYPPPAASASRTPSPRPCCGGSPSWAGRPSRSCRSRSSGRPTSGSWPPVGPVPPSGRARPRPPSSCTVASSPHRAWCGPASSLGLAPLAPLMSAVLGAARRGPHHARGGMFVDVAGLDPFGTPVSASWDMVAEGDDGPFVPAMAVASIVRRVLSGDVPAPGARPPAARSRCPITRSRSRVGASRPRSVASRRRDRPSRPRGPRRRRSRRPGRARAACRRRCPRTLPTIRRARSSSRSR